MQTQGGVPSQAVRARRLTRLSFLLVGLLLLQNVIGTALNLYVSLPTSPTFGQVFLSIPVLTAHILNAFVLVALAAVALVLIRREKILGASGWAALVLLGLVLALQEGFAFTFTQDNAFSYGMELGFLIGTGAQLMVLLRISAWRLSLGGTPPAEAVTSATG